MPNPLSGVESAATSPENATSQADVAGADAQRQANGSGNGILGTLPLPGGVDGRPAWVMILLDVVLWLCILTLVAIFLSPFPGHFVSRPRAPLGGFGLGVGPGSGSGAYRDRTGDLRLAKPCPRRGRARTNDDER